MRKIHLLMHQFKTEFISRLDPDYAYLKQAIRSGLAALISILIYRYQTHWPQGYWIILAAVFLMQTRLGNTLFQQCLTLIICGLSTAILTYITGFFWHNMGLLGLFLAATTFLSIYLGQLGVNFAIGGFFVNLFIVIAAGLETTSAEQLQRSAMILLGTSIAFALSFLFWSRPLDNWRRAIKVYLLCLSEFSGTISNSYKDPHYHLDKIKFEYHFHERRNRCIRMLNTLRHAFHLIKTSKQTDNKILSKSDVLTLQKNSNVTILDPQTLILENMEYLYNALIALANIRHRLTDSKDRIFYNNLAELHRLLSICLEEIVLKKSCNVLNPFTVAVEQLRGKVTDHNDELQQPLIAFIHIIERLPEELNTVCSLLTGEKI